MVSIAAQVLNSDEVQLIFSFVTYKVMKIYTYVSSESFIILDFTCSSMIPFQLIFVLQSRDPTLFFGMQISSCSSTNLLKTLYSFPIQWFLTLFWNYFTINIRVLFLDFHSTLLIYISVLMPLPHCLNNCSFVVSFEILEMWIFQLCSLIILIILSILHYHVNLRISLSIAAKKKCS